MTVHTPRFVRSTLEKIDNPENPKRRESLKGEIAAICSPLRFLGENAEIRIVSIPDPENAELEITRAEFIFEGFVTGGCARLVTGVLGMPFRMIGGLFNGSDKKEKQIADEKSVNLAVEALNQIHAQVKDGKLTPEIGNQLSQPIVDNLRAMGVKVEMVEEECSQPPAEVKAPSKDDMQAIIQKTVENIKGAFEAEARSKKSKTVDHDALPKGFELPTLEAVNVASPA
jgi:hypothetical protein